MKNKLKFNKQCITELNDVTMSTIDSGGTPTVATSTIVVGAPVTIVVGVAGVIIYTLW